jgi:hypothetical protein
MATGYTRNDTTNNIANGNVINAADLDGEFDAIQAAYDVTTGHDHDGTVGGGAPIKALGPAQDIVITTSVIRPKTDNTVDLGTSTLEFKDLFLDGTAKVDTLTVDESATIAANLTVDTTTLVVDATNNRVGVGTASPSTTLHISSATPIITLTDTDNPHSATINTNSATGSLSISADTGNAVADSAIILNIDNTEKVRVLADGSVGIGTATPSATLDVVGGAEINGDLTVTGNTTLGNAATDTVTITADVASNLIPSADNTYDLGASGSEWKDLYIDGTANIDALVADAATVITSTGGVLTLQRDDTAITSGETLGEIDFQAPNVSGGGDAIVVAATIKAVAGDTFDAAVNKTSLLFQTASSGAVATRMEIDGNGNVAVDTDTLFVDAVNDRVGINNASPSVALDVTGAATISGILTASSDVSIADKIIHTGDTNTAIRFPAADTVTIETAGTERMRVSSAGTVLVATTSEPSTSSAELFVNGDIAYEGRLLPNSASSNGTAASPTVMVGFDYDTGLFLPATNSIGFSAGGTERMRINASGNVGIGTTSPASIVGGTDTSPVLSIGGTDSALVVGDKSGSLSFITNDTSYTATYADGVTSEIASVSESGTGAAYGLALYTGTITDSNRAERLRISATGNVGIGTSAPKDTLDVVDGISVTDSNTALTTNTVLNGVDFYTSDPSFLSNTVNRAARIVPISDDVVGQSFALGFYTASVDVDATERMRIGSTGNVGIGTSSPERLLTVAGTTGDASGIIRLQSNNVNVADGLIGSVEYFNTDTSTDGPQIAAAINAYTVTTQGAGGYLTFATATGATGVEGASPIERLRITSTGNVGIGTTSPDFQLHVDNSAGNATIGIIAADASNSILYMGDQTDNNVAYIQYNHASNFMNFRTNDLDRMRITSAGDVGIGTGSTVSATLHVNSGAANLVGLFESTDAGATLTLIDDATTGGSVAEHGLNTVGDELEVRAVETLAFETAAEERARITSGGNLLVAKSANGASTVGIEANASGLFRATRSGGECIEINRLASDGDLVIFRQAGNTEGTISVSGTTVSYNGGHLSRWAQFPDNSRPELLKGTVMSNLDQMSNWDGEDNEQLNCVQVSTVEGDANVAGVFVAWDSADDGYNDILLAMTGDMVIRIAGGTTVQRGDLLMSAGDGTAKPQGDDIVRSKTIAKVTSTHVSHTYADGSYAVPCVLMAC